MKSFQPILVIMSIFLFQQAFSADNATNKAPPKSGKKLSDQSKEQSLVDSTSSTTPRDSAQLSAKLSETISNLDAAHKTIQLQSDSLALAKAYLDSLGGLYEDYKDSVKSTSTQTITLQEELKTQQLQLDSLQEVQKKHQEEGQKWKARFIWQLPFTLALFLLGFGIGGGHFP